MSAVCEELRMAVQLCLELDDSPAPNDDCKPLESTSSIPSADGLGWLGE
jgi:hypothetical protein